MNEIKLLLKQEYDLDVQEVRRMSQGVGGDTFQIIEPQGKWIYKIADSNEMNHPEREPQICDFLRRQGLEVSEFLKNRQGEWVTLYHQRASHVQKFIDGTVYGANQAPEWLMEQMALFLGKTHRILKAYKPLPAGIGRDFFAYMTPERAKRSYLRSYEKTDSAEIKADLEERIRLLERISNWQFDIDRLTCCNSHGDYTIHQVICGAKEIKGVIDWTCACRQPVVWEIARSFFIAEPGCAQGHLDEKKLSDYVSAYESIQPLTAYDKEQLLRVYIYQLAVCDYYSQYLNAPEQKKEEYLQQAQFGTKVLKNCGIM